MNTTFTKPFDVTRFLLKVTTVNRPACYSTSLGYKPPRPQVKVLMKTEASAATGSLTALVIIYVDIL